VETGAAPGVIAVLRMVLLECYRGVGVVLWC
jgi:hypothetical protein